MSRAIPPDTRAVEARAKVNLFLRVLGLRPDGYHDVETMIFPVSLADRLVVQGSAGPEFRTLSLSLSVSGDPEMVRGIPVDESNLALRAATVLAEEANVRGFADISLEKRVPSAAGMGGGSSDAAAVLRTLNDLWGCGLGPEDLSRVGADVGSDVPALLADGPVVATGRGELIRPVAMAPVDLVVVTFPFALSTPEVFGWWDQDGATGATAKGVLEAAARGEVEAVGAGMSNDLEPVVVRRHPDVGTAKELLVEGGVVAATMTGSGPSVVGLLAGPGARLEPGAAASLRELTGREALYV